MALSQDEKNLVDTLKKSGKDKTEILRIIAKRRTGDVTTQPDPTKEPSPLQSFTKGAIKGAGQIVKDTGDMVASGLPGMIAGPFNAIPGVNRAISEPIQSVKNTLQAGVGLTDENLTSQNAAEMAGKGTTIAASFVTPFVASSFSRLASRGVTAGKTALSSVAESGGQGGSVGGLRGAVDTGVGAIKSFIKDPKLALAKQNVSPQLESSANRLFVEGTERLNDPLATYDTYLTQAKSAINDIKADPPISQVGESIGNAFRTVVQKRRDVGKTLETELKKTANNPVSLKGTLQTFQQELLDNGVSYDAVDRKVLTSSASKFSDADRKTLEMYASELQKLGSNPTMRDLDAFVSRIPNEIEELKASRNLKTVTNAERIIGTHLANLRSTLTKSGTPEYAAARTEYSKLSNFITEGSQFLGKVTQDGDFARDASLAKSAVQSILNNGKKDWLNELEELTQYPALDDSVLALQAMKDAGDFRGLSLLDELSKGAPTSAAGFSQRVIDYAMAKVGRAVGGTPEEQTRAFLQALKEGAEREAKGGSSGATSNAAFGAATGVMPDENGNVEVDPMNAAIGVGAAALGIKLSKGGPEKVASILKNAKPVDYERFGDFLKQIETRSLSNQMRVLDNYGPFLEKHGLGDNSVDEIIQILNRVMMQGN